MSSAVPKAINYQNLHPPSLGRGLAGRFAPLQAISLPNTSPRPTKGWFQLRVRMILQMGRYRNMCSRKGKSGAEQKVSGQKASNNVFDSSLLEFSHQPSFIRIQTSYSLPTFKHHSVPANRPWSIGPHILEYSCRRPEFVEETD